MIPLESLRRFRKIYLLAIMILAILWSAVTYLLNLSNNQLAFMLSLFITTILITFTALLIRRLGAVTLFYLLCALITFRTNNLSILGWNKVIILVTAGIIFELFFLLLRIEIKNIPFDIVLGAAFSMASIPFTMLLLLIPATKEIMPYVWNFALMAFIIGMMGSITMFLIWYNIKGKKALIKFEYSV